MKIEKTTVDHLQDDAANGDHATEPLPEDEMSGPQEPVETSESERVAHPPNEKALAVLKAVQERQRSRPTSDSTHTQAYIRQARDGGMYGYISDDETLMPGH